MSTDGTVFTRGLRVGWHASARHAVPPTASLKRAG